MRRLLIFITVLYVIWRVLIIIGRRMSKTVGSANPFGDFFKGDRSRRGGEDGRGEQLVACSQCGTLFPASRAIQGSRGAVYCSEACRRHARGGDGGANDASQ